MTDKRLSHPTRQRDQNKSGQFLIFCRDLLTIHLHNRTSLLVFTYTPSLICNLEEECPLTKDVESVYNHQEKFKLL